MKEKLEELYKEFESQVSLMKNQAEVLNLKAEFASLPGTYDIKRQTNRKSLRRPFLS